jgi:hypothetical protein
VLFILEFYITQFLISTTSRFECISGLIKVTGNNDARWKLEIDRKLPLFCDAHTVLPDDGPCVIRNMLE